MIEIDYKDWWEICIENQHGLKDKNSAAWAQGDFTLFTRFKTNFDIIKKDAEENNACCVIGKPGLHLGLYITTDGYIKFDWWTKETPESDPKFNHVFVPQKIDNQEWLKVFVSHDSVNKEFVVCFYNEVDELMMASSNRYTGELVDYSWSNTYIGCAYHHKNTYPHNGFWAGTIDYIKAVDFFTPKIVLEDEIYFDDLMTDVKYENTWFHYNGEPKTYATISDISGHSNHLRHKRQWYIETFRNYEVELMNGINKKGSTII